MKMKHGVLSTYTHQGCRCKLCKEAKRSYEEDRRTKIRKGTWSNPSARLT